MSYDPSKNIPFALAAICLLLVPLMALGFAIGFIGEMFMIGFRSGREIVEGVSAKANAAHAAKQHSGGRAA